MSSHRWVHHKWSPDLYIIKDSCVDEVKAALLLCDGSSISKRYNPDPNLRKNDCIKFNPDGFGGYLILYKTAIHGMDRWVASTTAIRLLGLGDYNDSR